LCCPGLIRPQVIHNLCTRIDLVLDVCVLDVCVFDVCVLDRPCSPGTMSHRPPVTVVDPVTR
jgi:hypothetical protein